MNKYLIEIRHADVSLNGKKVLHDITWKLAEGENWAVIGPNGAGKSTFLKLIQGDVWPEPLKGQERIYRLDGEQDTPLGMKGYISLVTPELYHFYFRNELNLPVEEVVCSGASGTVWLQEKPARETLDRARDVMKQTGADVLMGRNLLELSQGEARKVLIARAIMPNPRILLLDEICDGLDAGSRKEVLLFLDRIAREGTQIVFATHRVSELIPSISKVMTMRGGRITEQAARNLSNFPGKESPPQILAGGRRGNSSPAVLPGRRAGRPLIRITGASVYREDKKVLDHIDWEIRSGENWAIAGRNGSGKTTLLRLVEGSLNPALGGRVERFGGEERESIWESRKKIGYVSPELQAHYDEDLSAEEVVASGFFSSIGLYSRISKEQRARARSVMRSLGSYSLAGKRIGEMSYGEFRKVLIARAMVNRPEILLLDEPFNGLDSESKEDLKAFLEVLCQGGTAVVVVTHHLDEITPSITHAMVIDKGKMVTQGRKEEVLRKALLSG